jgi:putative hemolysin
VSEFLSLLLLLLLSGLFSGSETALVGISIARVEALVLEKRPGALALYQLKRDPVRMLTAILIGNNIVNIAASAMATVIATEWLGHIGPGIAVGVLTILILIFGEITPKSLATRYSERISLTIAPLLLAYLRAVSPLVWLLSHFTDWVNGLSRTNDDPTVTEAELISLVEHGEEEGTIEKDERELIERVFELNDLTANDVMTPTRKLLMLDGRCTIGELLPEVLSGTYSRIPLYGEDPNEVQRVLIVRDMLENVIAGRTDVPAFDVARTPHFVPENQHLDELLVVLRSTKQHMAVVVDETGYVQGVVTFEDLIEELVGEIYDETDAPAKPYEQLAADRILVNGDVELRVIEEFFDCELPGKPTDTVSRWILEHTARIPAIDEELRLDGMDIRVQDASERRIRCVVLSRTAAEPAAGKAATKSGSQPRDPPVSGQDPRQSW